MARVADLKLLVRLLERGSKICKLRQPIRSTPTNNIEIQCLGCTTTISTTKRYLMAPVSK
ncbi:hypothetical protein MMC26_000768, partial [Xylographa opegraphella]|nr:hypothetical protein [Xylographa opegraphella]